MKELSADSRDNQVLVYYVGLFLVAVIGLVYALNFVGHFAFPNSDFTTFVDTGKTWLSGKIPDSMKRGPVFSMMTVFAGTLFSGPERYLTGTEWLNSLLLPVFMILVYLIAKEFLGKPIAVWTAILVGISPSVIYQSSQPLAEMTILVFFALAVLCIRIHIGLAYLFAVLCMLTRWDMAGVLVGVAVADIIKNRKWKRTLLLAALAAVPFAVCILITLKQLKGQSGGAHYLQVLSEERVFALPQDLKLYWSQIASFLAAPLLTHGPDGNIVEWTSLNTFIFIISSILISGCFLVGAAVGLIKKRPDFFAMLIPAIPYVLIHSVYPYRLARFCVPVAWVGTVCAFYGLLWFWQKINQKQSLRVICIVLSIPLFFTLLFWSLHLFETLKVAGNYCPPITRTFWIAFAITLPGVILMNYLADRKLRLSWLTLSAFCLLTLVSNAASTGFLMGKGDTDAGFISLARWYAKNATPSDRMITTMSSYMPLYSGKPENQFVHINAVGSAAKSFEDFIRICRTQGITLIAWDSRLAGHRSDRYYKLWGLEYIEVLGAPYSSMPQDKKTQLFTQFQQQLNLSLVALIKDQTPVFAVYRLSPLIQE
jgi:hypothetical protein